MQENIEAVGLPEWSDDDQTLARAVQAELGNEEQPGLATSIGPLPEPIIESQGGFSDDLGDISWNVPTVTLRFPSNIPGLPGHHWASAVAMATPIAHKGATAGAKVQAMTVLDFLLRPDLGDEAWEYFREVQTKDMTYTPFIGSEDTPALHLNRDIMAQFGPQLEEHYFDPTRYDTYLEQFGNRVSDRSGFALDSPGYLLRDPCPSIRSARCPTAIAKKCERFQRSRAR